MKPSAELTKNDESDPDLDVPKEHLVLVDEADYLFLHKFCKVNGEGAILELTATSYEAMRTSE